MTDYVINAHSRLWVSLLLEIKGNSFRILPDAVTVKSDSFDVFMWNTGENELTVKALSLTRSDLANVKLDVVFHPMFMTYSENTFYSRSRFRNGRRPVLDFQGTYTITTCLDDIPKIDPLQLYILFTLTKAT
jgi:hypothetical protein